MISLFAPHYRTDEVLAQIRVCLEKGWTGLGYLTLEFERAWKDYTSLPYAHFTNSCTSALHLAVRLLKDDGQWKDGDEVITTPLSFVSTNHAILYERLYPVFGDVDCYLCLDPVTVERSITERTRAVCFVGFGGSTGQLEAVANICERHNLALIIDAAHMAGTRLRGTMDWMQLGDAVCFSFHSVKNLPTADGGMLCLRNEELDQRARRLSWLGIDKDTYLRTTTDTAYRWRYMVNDVGYKYHGNSVMAAMGLVGLKYLDQDNAYRRQLATWYDQYLGPVYRIPLPDGCESSRHLYQILVPNRDTVLLALNGQEIYPGVHYDVHTNYPMYGGSCPKAEDISRHVLSLPLHLGLTHADIVYISRAVRIAMGEA